MKLPQPIQGGRGRAATSLARPAAPNRFSLRVLCAAARIRFLILNFSFLILNFPASGQIQQAWVSKYNNGITNGQHQALKMLLDGAGNVCLTGFSQNTNGGTGYAILEYAPNGSLRWATRFDSTNFSSATPTGLVIDGSNNVLVTGTAVTLKLGPNGNVIWNLPYNGTAVAVDNSNNVAITGVNSNYTTMKFSPGGSNLWQQTFPSSEPCLGQAITADAQGNTYVAGSESYNCDVDPTGCYIELLTVKYSQNGAQLWSLDQSPGQFKAVQVAGFSQSGGNLYCSINYSWGSPQPTTIDMSLGGTVFWIQYNSTVTGTRPILGLAVDRGNNAVVTGASYVSSGPFSTYPGTSYGTVFLATNGTVTSTALYPTAPQRANGANAIARDSVNNVYVTGYSSEMNGTNDIVTIAYDANGNQLWLQRYVGLGYGAVGNAIAADNNGNVYVAGYENVPGGGTEMVLIKYSPVTLQHQSNGNFLLQAQGAPNEPFDIQATTNLRTWLDLGSHDADTNGVLQYLDTNAALFPWRFYLAIPQ